MSKIQLTFTGIFLTVAIPLVILLYQTYSQLQVGTESKNQGHAMFVANTLNQQIAKDLATEENRSYTAYGFIRTVQVIGGEENTLSELVSYPVASPYEGLLGHFQIAPDNSLRTPFLPEGKLGAILLEQLSTEERARREEVRLTIDEILKKFGFYSQEFKDKTRVPVRDSVEAVIDQVYQRNLGDLELSPATRSNRYEVTSEKEDVAFNAENPYLDSAQYTVDNILTQEVEIEPFQAKVNKEYAVFYRNVRRGSLLYVQGFVVHLPSYISNLVSSETQVFAGDQNLIIQYLAPQGVIAQFGSLENSDFVFSTPLPAPLNEVEIAIYIQKDDYHNGAAFLIFLGIVVIALLGGGLISIYRFTHGEINLAKKRQDFISAVSHELKTPLTSIRMYAELLQNMWVANEEKKKKYYSQIASEAERLTRLIQNVLDLSKLDGNRWTVSLKQERPKAVLDDFVAMYTRNIERQGFALTVSCDTDVNDLVLTIDRDAIMQILTNLVDNSIKFSAKAEYKMIVIELRVINTDVYLAVRDYGPGIPQAEMKKVFDEFYRVENEMTRTTKGTGIGLSMVKKLCNLTNMKIEIENANPGLRTKIHFPPLTL